MDELNFRERYRRLVQTVLPFAACWNQSVLHFWPACRDALPDEFWRELVEWPLEDLYAVDEWISSGGETGFVPGMPEGLRDFVEMVRPLLQFEEASSFVPLAEAQTLRMTAKKQHEIGAILPFIRQKKSILGFAHGVDIGGGVGHLARSLLNHLQLPMVSIDRDDALQALGRSLSAKQEVSDEQLRFVLSEVQAEAQDIDALFDVHSLSLGLHTCGPLAWAHLEKSRTSLCVLNFGCCYDRMDVSRDCERSVFARQHPLPFSSFALFLATRGRRRTLAELATQERVNTWRVALHLFLLEEGLATGFIGVGDSSRKTYQEGFSAYVADRLQSLNIPVEPYRSRADSFIQRPDTQRSMREFFILNIVRNAFARPLEVLILLDRALWLEEQGRQVQIQKFFDPTLSPRNLGIFAASCL